MEVTASALLQKLPPYQDQWILIKENQEVKDIKKRIEVAHKKYAEYYDLIALYFDADTIEKICNNICDFISKNIEYREEPNEMQTTSLVTGILYRGFGDCKHYALIAGGILNSIERLTGKKIDWVYRFASYGLNPTPHHVFVVVFDKGDEIWIDPVPGSETITPLWMQDKKVNVSSMALYENIAGITPQEMQRIGTKSVPVYPVKTHDLNFDNQYPGFTDVWKSHGSPVLTLDPGYGGNCDAWNGYNIANLPQLTDALNFEIAKGPEPHTVTADLVDWIWKSNVRSWNFYYTQGVAPDVIEIADERLPATWPRPIITADGRLTFDKLANIGECHNPYIHLLTGAIQKMLNDYLGTDHSYIISPNQPVEYMNYQHPDQFNKINMFNQISGDNFFQSVLKVVKSAFTAYAEFQMKIAFATPRNSFMGMLAVNLFKWATHLEQHITDGDWPQISQIWEGMGGNPTRLLQAIEKGAKEPAIDEKGNSISGAPAAAAYITASIPVIALMLKYLDKTGKASEIVAAAEPALALQFPQIDWTGLKNGMPAIDRATGKPVQFIATDKDTSTGGDLLTTAKENPLPVAAAVGIGTHFLFNKKGRKPNYLIPVLAAGATYFFLSQSPHNTQPVLLPGDANQLTALLNWLNGTNESAASKASLTSIFKSMSTDEIASVYDYIFNYYLKEKQVDPGTVLYNKIQAISSKYNIFT